MIGRLVVGLVVGLFLGYFARYVAMSLLSHDDRRYLAPEHRAALDHYDPVG